MTDPKCRKCNDEGGWPWGTDYCDCEAGQTKRIRDDQLRDKVTMGKTIDRARIPVRARSRYIDESSRDYHALHEWIGRRHPEENLIICGPIGTGKTIMAVHLMQKFILQGERDLLFQSVPEMLDQMRPPVNDNSLLTQIKTCNVLVLDDVGVEKSSDWARERLYVIINARYESMLPTIVTTNMSAHDLKLNLGERTMSRLGENVMTIILKGADRRGASGNSREGTERGGVVETRPADAGYPLDGQGVGYLPYRPDVITQTSSMGGPHADDRGDGNQQSDREVGDVVQGHDGPVVEPQ